MKEYVSEGSPFLKWAGGKSQLLAVLGSHFPSNFGTYFEPFLGGGAVFFHLFNSGRLGRAVLSDSNRDLINCYVVVRDAPDKLLTRLGELQKHAKNKRYYYGARKRFNEIKLRTAEDVSIEKASLLLYLNKTCYNGLYRVNRKGEFNVPWGDYKNPHIFNDRNLKEVSMVLNRRGIEIRCQDYTKVLDEAYENDFIYFDPPYQPVSETANFTSYTPDSFTQGDQERLAKVFRALASKGCFVMLSNSPKARHLYEEHGYHIETVRASRAISSVGSKRGPIEELLIMNY